MIKYPYFNQRIPGGFREYILNITVLWAAIFSLGVMVLVLKKYNVLSTGPYNQMTSGHYRLITAET